MVSGLITSWQMEVEKSANNDRLYFLELPNHYKMKRHLFLGIKSMTILDSVLKSKDMTLLINVHLVKAMVCLVVI